MSISRVEQMKHIESKVRRCNKKFQADRQSFIAWSRVRKGFRATGISIVSDTRIDHLGRWPVNYIRGHARWINLGTGGAQESQVLILWNCGLWAHHVVLFFNRSSDILHGHDSKACQGVPCQLCRQQHWYQGRGTKRTIFLLVETRRTNRQGSRPSVVTGMSST